MKFELGGKKTIELAKKIIDILSIISLIIVAVVGFIYFFTDVWYLGITTIILGMLGVAISYVLIQVLLGMAYNLWSIKNEKSNNTAVENKNDFQRN